MRLDILIFPSRADAMARIAHEPERSRRHMWPQFSGAVDGWAIEWRLTTGTIRYLTNAGWRYIWRASDQVGYQDVSGNDRQYNRAGHHATVGEG